MKRAIISLMGLILVTASSVVVAQASVQRPRQYILISFDGSYTASMWQATREHALASQAKVTHFISGVDFLMGSSSRVIPGAVDHIYEPPRRKPAPHHLTRSDIGFGGDRSQVIERIQQMNASMRADMEIGGHANAHFDGSAWSTAEWTYEFNHFFDYVYNVFSINSIDEDEVGVKIKDWKSRLFPHLKSFRAPYLGRGKGLWETIGRDSWNTGGKINGPLLYDASDIADSPTAWPSKDARGFWYFRMAAIPVPGHKRPVLSMDWNMVVADAKDKNNPEAWTNISPEKSAKFEEQTYSAYINWFLSNYYGNRAPLNIGHHFSTWNGGAYWRALKRFMTDVCSQPEVACIKGVDLVEELEGTSSSTLNAYRHGEFDRSGTPRLDIARKQPISLATDPTQIYRRSRDGFADLPHKAGVTYKWRIGNQDLSEQRVHLTELAKQGVSRIDIAASNSGGNTQVMPFYIQWNPLAGTAELIKWNEPLIQPCNTQTHEEKVDATLLTEGHEI